MHIRALVIDDEAGWIEVCSDTLSEDNVEVIGAMSIAEGKAILEQNSFDLIFADRMLPDGQGTELVRFVAQTQPEIPVIMITAFPSIDTAIEALREGAYDYLVKPFSPDQLRAVARRAIERGQLQQENRLLARTILGRRLLRPLVGSSSTMQRVLEKVAQVAPTSSEVLIVGPSGTGKELVARAIHQTSAQASKPFVPVDCGAMPESLVESELFGYEKGAFTGANQRQIGLLDYGAGGTVFFDEIGELAPTSQAKLLRVLQEKQFRRIGGRKSIPCDVRVLAATNRNLEQEVASGRFREDLYYRLNVFEIRLSPLRERRSDIPELAEHFMTVVAEELGCPRPTGLSERALDLCKTYDWPGNARELRNAIKRATVIASGLEIDVQHLPDTVRNHAALEVETNPGAGAFHRERASATATFERTYLAELLKRHQGRVKNACAEAGLSRSSMYFLLQRHNIDPGAYRGG